jgi:transcriptional regulator GlxA family with amidase domain
VRNIIENFACEIAREMRGSERGAVVPQEFMAVRRHIAERFDEPMSLASLAEMANLSVPHFCAMFKKYFGQPPIDMLIDHRMSHAVYLLRDVSLSISEIARRVGYSDIYHFSKLFKNRYGESPRRMRERLTSRRAQEL